METQLESLDDFFGLVKEVWTTGVFGMDLGDILLALGIFLLAVVLRGLFTRIVLTRLRAMAQRTETELDDLLLDALEQPIRFVPVVVGAFFAFDSLPLTGTAEGVADKVLRSLIVVSLFWVFYNAIDPLSTLMKRLEALFSSEMVRWILRIGKLLVIFLGVATVLELWGIEVGPILAGLGLFGVAVALGAQDLFKNLIAGFLIIAERRFSQGDWIRVDGTVEGTVEKLGFRSTRVRQFDKAPVTVPNAMLADNALINFSAMTHRRIKWIIGVEYRTSIDQLRRIRDEIEAYVAQSEEFAGPPDVPRFVRIDAFNDSSIDILLYCFTKTTKWGEWLEIKERLAYRIKDIVEGAGSGFAFPSQSVYVETLPNPDLTDAPAERYVPPVSLTKALGDVGATGSEGEG